jgi:hypothetical protein
VLDFQSFGAYKDGTHVTETTAAWLAFIAALTTQGGTGVVPPGTYLIETTAVTDAAMAPFTLTLDPAATLLAAHDNRILLDIWQDGGIHGAGVAVSGGQWGPNGHTGVTGVRVRSTINAGLTHLYMLPGLDAGIEMLTDAGVGAPVTPPSCEGFHIADCFIDRPAVGLFWHVTAGGGPSFAESQLDKVFVNLPTTAGFKLGDATQSNMTRQRWHNILVWVEAGTPAPIAYEFGHASLTGSDLECGVERTTGGAGTDPYHLWFDGTFTTADGLGGAIRYGVAGSPFSGVSGITNNGGLMPALFQSPAYLKQQNIYSNPASSSTFATAGYGYVRVTALAGNVTGMILGLPFGGGGNAPAFGLEIAVANEDPTSTITFAAAGTSNVADGAADVIAPLSVAHYFFGAGELWFRVK